MAGEVNIPGLKELFNDWKDLRKEVKRNEKTLVSFSDKITELNKSFKGSGLRDFIQLQKENVRLSVELEKAAKKTKKVKTDEEVLNQKILATKKALRLAQTKESKTIQQTRIQVQELNKANKLNARESLGLVGAYEKLSRELNNNRKKAKDAAVQYGTNSKQFKSLANQVNITDAKLKSIDKTLGQSQRNVGNYGSALKGIGRNLLGSLGVVGGITALVSVIRSSISISREFEQSNANLASVLGKTSEQINTLTSDAQRLGASTAFTATQVNELQTEFAKLGFNEDQILNATESTLNLAAATGTDLANAASVAGSTLGGFKLSADQTQRVTDVMAKSFSTSALDIEKFKESMKTAAPAAKAVGVDVEKTTALLGVLSNAGISGSKAGNALKNSFINLNKEGLTLNDGFEKVNESNNKLATAVSLVGKEAATAFLVLSEGSDSLESIEKGLRNAGGAAEIMANEQLNTLSGDVKILNSAWEGLVLSLLNGDSGFSKVSRGLVQFATNLIGASTESEKVSDALVKQKTDLNSLVSAITSSNTTNESRARLIERLNKNYPDFLKNINKEKVTNSELLSILKDVNEQLLEKIRYQVSQEKIQENQKKLNTLIREEDDILIGIEKSEDRISKTRSRDRAIAVNTLRNRKIQLSENRKEQQRILDIINDIVSKQEKANDTDVNNITTNETETVFSVNNESKNTYKSDLLALRLFRLENENDALNDIINNEESHYLDRIKASEDLAKNKKKILDLSRKYELSNADNTGSKVKLINEKYASETLEIYKDKESQITDVTQKELDNKINSYKVANDKIRDNEEFNQQEDLIILKTKLLRGNITEEQFEKEKQKQKLKYQKETLVKQLDNLNESLFIEGLTAEQSIEISRQISKAKNDILDADLESFKNNEDEKKQKLEEFLDAIKSSVYSLTETLGISASAVDSLFDLINNNFETSAEKAQAYGEIAKGVFGKISEAAIANTEIQLQQLDTQRENQLSNESLSAEQREQIEKRYEAKKKRILEKQAQAKKRASVVEAVINTAVAVTSALPNFVLAGIVAALGAAEIAAISSQPLPKYAKGVNDSKYEGLAIKDELGAELHFNKKGKLKDKGQNKGAKYTHVEKGDTIIPAHISKQMLSEGAFSNDLMNSITLNGLVNLNPTNTNKGISKSEMRDVLKDTLQKQTKNKTSIFVNGEKVSKSSIYYKG